MLGGLGSGHRAIAFIQHVFIIFLHFKWVSLVAQMVKNLPAMLETWVQSLGGEDALEKEMATTPMFLPGKSHG